MSGYLNNSNIFDQYNLSSHMIWLEEKEESLVAILNPPHYILVVIYSWMYKKFIFVYFFVRPYYTTKLLARFACGFFNDPNFPEKVYVSQEVCFYLLLTLTQRTLPSS